MLKKTKKQRRGKEKTLSKGVLSNLFYFGVVLLTLFSLASSIDWNTNVVSYYTLNESLGTLNDSTSNGYNGTAIGTITQKFIGLIGNASNFTSGYINTTIPIAITSNDTYSISLWFKTNNVGEMILVDTTGSHNYFRFSTGTGKIEYPITANITNLEYNNNSWFHYVETKSISERVLYLNGEVKINTTNSFENTGYWIFGSRSDSLQSFKGLIDEVSFWDKVLSSSEIIELYNGGSGITFQGSLTLMAVNLDYPANGASLGSSSFNLTTNYTINNHLFNLTNATHYIWYENGTLFNSTILNVTGDTTNFTTKEFSGFTLANYKWNVQACGTNSTSTFCTFADSNSTFEVGASIDNESYPTETYETDNELFNINITVASGINLYAARLVYNGTSYLATKRSLGGESYELIKYLDIPLLTNSIGINKTFYWEFEYKNNVIGKQTSDVRSHKVNELLFTLCNNTYSIPYVNFTGYSESNYTSLNTDLDGSFYFWTGEGNIKKNYSIEAGGENASYALCSNYNNSLNGAMVNVNSIINVQATNHSQRTFYFNEEKYTNATTNVTLLLMEKGLGTSIIIAVTDEGLVPYEGLFVNVYRYYPSTNDYRIIERARTDEFGQFVARMIEPNTIKYQFEFINSKGVILKRTEDVAIACRTTICIIPFVIEDTTDYFERFENITDFDYSLSFDNSTNIFSYSWNDVTGDSITSRLLVQKIDASGITTICNITSTSTSSSLTCNVSSYIDGKFRAQAFRDEGDGEERILILNVEVGGVAGIFGTEGMFWGFFLVFTLMAIGCFNPTIGIILYLSGFIGLGILGIIPMSLPVFFAQLIIGVLFIWAIRS